MSINYDNGNILHFEEGVICHQVNCMGVMGAGLAKQIADKWPKVYGQYKLHCQLSQKTVHIVHINHDLYVANLFGQFTYGRGKHTDYDMLEHALFGLSKAFDKIIPIYIPYNMGCGLGGGEWVVVLGLIESILGCHNVTIVRY